MEDFEPLSENQIIQMCWAKNPNSKRPTKLKHTPELETDYRDWIARECDHSVVEVTRCLLSNNAEQIREQCVECGKPFSQPMKKASLANLESIRTGTVEHHFEYEESRRAELDAIRQKHFSQQSRPGWGSSEYQEYLKSDAWKSKRAAVMRRARDVCEGCGGAKATVVHHHHYHNIYNEWLWELVALCQPCHQQCHPEHRVGDD